MFNDLQAIDGKCMGHDFGRRKSFGSRKCMGRAGTDRQAQAAATGIRITTTRPISMGENGYPEVKAFWRQLRRSGAAMAAIMLVDTAAGTDITAEISVNGSSPTCVE